MTDLLTEKSPQSDDFYGMETSLYPNPNNGSFKIKADYNNIESIQVIDILGRVRYEELLQPKALKYGKQFDINSLNSGLYFVRLVSGNLSKIIKMAVN